MEYIIKADKKNKEIQDVYSTCVKTIISEVSENFAEIVCKNLIPPLIQGIKQHKNSSSTL